MEKIKSIYSKENYHPESSKIPPMMLIYGEAGIGKSTFCSTFSNPFFFDFEARTHHIKNITRDRDFNLSIDKLNSWSEFIDAIRQLKNTEYRTIIFDGITRLQTFIWQAVAKKLGVSDPRGLAFGRGYAESYELFTILMNEAKILQRIHKKTIIFVDHEKIKEDGENATPNQKSSYGKYYPECMNGILRILIKETDYILRMVEDIEVRENAKTKETTARFCGLKILTNRQKNMESFLKTSLKLPDSIIANYTEFQKAYKEASS